MLLNSMRFTCLGAHRHSDGLPARAAKEALTRFAVWGRINSGAQVRI